MIHIRPLEVNDLERAGEVILIAFNRYVAPSFSAEGVATFVETASVPNLIGSWQEGEVMRGAFLDDALVGVAVMRGDRHLKLMFVHPDYHGQGIARQLWSAVYVACLLRNAQPTPFTLAATDYALPVYLRFGFEASAERQEKNGIIFTPMQLTV